MSQVNLLTLYCNSQARGFATHLVGVRNVSRKRMSGFAYSFPQRGQPLPGLQQDCVYMDYNATTPVWPEVAEEMKPYFLQYFGNPSSAHAFGHPCRKAVDIARKRVANLVGAHADEICFTSCGTESDSWAIWSAVMHARRHKPAGHVPHVVTTCIEHPAVLECLAAWKKLGLLEYTAVPVSSEGIVAVADIQAAITPATALITVMHSNNEVGSLQPICEIASSARELGILVHSDAAQSIGKVPVDVQHLGVDMLTIVGHKFGASKGVAALYVRRGVQIERFLNGGGQESGRRGGTESVALIVGLGKAAVIAQEELPEASQQLSALRVELLKSLMTKLPKDRIRVNGPADPTKQLPNTLSISIKGILAFQLLAQMSGQLAASAGAACHSHGGATISPVLAALKVPEEYAMGTLRLSVGRHTTLADVEKAAELIAGYCS